MESITKFFKEENDILYRKGEVKGVEKGIVKGHQEKQFAYVTKLVAKSGMSDEEIAFFADVPLTFVRNIRPSLETLEMD